MLSLILTITTFLSGLETPPAIAVQTVSSERDTCITRGIAAMNSKNYALAATVFDSCLIKFPMDPGLYFQRGTAYLLMNKANIALVDLNRTLQLNPQFTEAYYNRGLAHQALGNFTFAEADFQEYRKQVPKEVRVIRNQALLAEDMQEFGKAVMFYSEALELEPGNRELLMARAMAFASMDSTDAAVRDLDACIRQNPQDTAVIMSKGNILYDAMRFQNAVDAYNVILLLYPDDKNALANRADAFTASGRYEEAIRDYNSLSTSDRYNPDYYFNSGFCQLQISQNKEAILSFCKALDTEYPDLGLLLTLRGVAYNNLNMQAEACADWKKAILYGYAEAVKYKENYCR